MQISWLLCLKYFLVYFKAMFSLDKEPHPHFISCKSSIIEQDSIYTYLEVLIQKSDYWVSVVYELATL